MGGGKKKKKYPKASCSRHGDDQLPLFSQSTCTAGSRHLRGHHVTSPQILFLKKIIKCSGADPLTKKNSFMLEILTKTTHKFETRTKLIKLEEAIKGPPAPPFSWPVLKIITNIDARGRASERIWANSFITVCENSSATRETFWSISITEP